MLLTLAVFAVACGTDDADDAPATPAAPATTAAPAETTATTVVEVGTTTTTAAPAGETTTTTAAPTTTTEAMAEPLTGREATVVIGKKMDGDTKFDPARAFEELYVLVLGSVYNNLAQWAQTDTGYDYQTLLPELATEWSSNADATQWTFTLDPNARFHDGSPVTSDDVAFSFMRLKNVAATPSYQAANLDSVDTPDPQTVVVNLAAPDAEFPGLTTAAAFSILNSELVMANGGAAGEDASETDTAGEWLALNSAGSGPFTFDFSEPGSRLEIVRVDDYWGGPPAVMERIIMVNIPEAQSRIDALARGDIDLAWTVIPHQAATLGEDYTILQANTNHWYYVIFTTDAENNNAFVANPTVQKALKYAIDYDGLQRLCPGYTANRVYGLAPMRLGGITEGYERDLDKAKELLAEAGYPDGYDDPENPIRLQTFQWSGFCPGFGDVAQKLAADFADIGVKTEVQIRDVGVFFTDFRKGDLDINVSDWFPDFPSAMNSAAVSFADGFINWQRSLWPDNAEGWPLYDEIKAAGDAALASVDPAERLSLLNDVERLSLEANPTHLMVEIPEWYPHVNTLTGVYYHAVHRFEPYRMGRSR
ncbi:MAG: ABC transporter substrate-binding protein [bacterium]|nr:ABC transporter substrate-binding protein [bacterium]MDE0352085.1 ABC transporter substrate-binding protein [bacterium]